MLCRLDERSWENFKLNLMQIFKKTAKEFGMQKKGKTLTKQGCLAEPKKEVDKKEKRGPSSNRSYLLPG